MNVGVGVIVASLGLAGCGASVPPPRDREAAAAARVSAAREAGARETARGVLQLQLAEEQLENARALMREGDNRAAQGIFLRAQMDAELALALARENKARIRADEDVTKASTVRPASAIGGGPADPPEQVSSPPENPNGPRAEVVASARQPLMGDKSMRAEAEKRAREALDKIAVMGVGSVRLEERGTIITMPGAALFGSDRANLLPLSHDNLDLVADALKVPDGHQIVVEGYTDSHGADLSNRELSQRRAQAVRDYLVSRGVPADRIRAQGLGAIRPVADNGTIAGRAKNRRIEIVVQPVVEE